MDEDLKACLFTRRRSERNFALPGKSAREMAQELVQLTKGDSNKIKAILSELLHSYPDKSIDWYLEQAMNKLHKNYKSQ